MHSMMKYNSTFKQLVKYIENLNHQPNSFSICKSLDDAVYIHYVIYCNDDLLEIGLTEGEVTYTTLEAIKRFMYRHRQIN